MVVFVEVICKSFLILPKLKQLQKELNKSIEQLEELLELKKTKKTKRPLRLQIMKKNHLSALF